MLVPMRDDMANKETAQRNKGKLRPAVSYQCSHFLVRLKRATISAAVAPDKIMPKPNDESRNHLVSGMPRSDTAPASSSARSIADASANRVPRDIVFLFLQFLPMDHCSSIWITLAKETAGSCRTSGISPLTHVMLFKECTYTKHIMRLNLHAEFFGVQDVVSTQHHQATLR